MRIHLTPGANALSDFKRETGRNPLLESCIILADDLESFSYTMSIPVRQNQGPAVLVEPGVPRPMWLLRDLDSVSQTQLKCELRDTRYRSIDPALQHKLLVPLTSIVGPGQRVTFTGKICKPQEVQQLKRIMSPSLVCLTTLCWRSLETLMMGKDIGDACYEHEDLDYVLPLYTTISMNLDRLVEPGRMHDQIMRILPKMIGTMHVFNIDLKINIAIGYLKLANIPTFIVTSDYVIQSWRDTHQEAGDVPIPSGIVAYFTSILLWRRLYEHRYNGRRHEKITVRQMVRKLAALELGSHQAHDYEILKRVPDQEAILSEEHLPLDQCSATQLPFPVISYYKEGENLMQRGHFKGMQDEELIRSLDPDAKKAINEEQSKHGWDVTAFDQV